MKRYFKILISWLTKGYNDHEAWDEWLESNIAKVPAMTPCKHENWGAAGFTNLGTCYDCQAQFYFTTDETGQTYYKLIENN